MSLPFRSIAITALALSINFAIHAAAEEPQGEATKWSELITVETIENEVHQISQQLSQALATLRHFQRGGYKQARLAHKRLTGHCSACHQRFQ